MPHPRPLIRLASEMLVQLKSIVEEVVKGSSHGGGAKAIRETDAT